jgi:hypothetical protein
MSLVNIRVSAEEKIMAAELRAQGVKMSELFRRVLREEHRRRCTPRKSKQDVRKIMDEIYKKYPIPADAPRHGIDTTDRRQVSAYIRQKLLSRKQRSK